MTALAAAHRWCHVRERRSGGGPGGEPSAVALGEDPTADHLVDTPRRVAAACTELLSAAPFSMTTFPNEEAYDEMVPARDILFTSLCRHHLLPFRGRAHVAYLGIDSHRRAAS